MPTPPNKLTTILGRMADLDHQSVDKDLMACLYAGPGAGKTTTILGLAQRIRGEGRILLLDSAEGYVSMEAFPSLMDGVQIVPNTTSVELPAIADALARKAKGFEDFTVVVLDESSSHYQEILEKVTRKRAGVGDDETMPEIDGPDYGPANSIFTSIIKSFQRIDGLHVLLVAHDREKDDKRRGITIAPQFPPLALKELQKLMHVTAYLSARIDAAGAYTRTVQAKPTASIQAKTRIPNMPVACSPTEFIDLVANWVLSDTMAEDVNAPEVNEEVPEGTLPVDGPALEPDDDADQDDAPVFVGESA